MIIEGLDSGTESLGWLLMYLVCAIKFDTGCNIVDALMEERTVMRNRMTIAAAVLCITMILSACGGSGEDTAHVSEPAVTPIGIGQDINASASADDNNEVNSDEASDNTMDVLSEDQAYTAVINYCKATESGFSDESSAEGHTEYWDVSTNKDGEIVVLYRSYTAAQIRYYIQPVTGEAYVTELVPGIIDEEQETGEKFNARDYLVNSGRKSEETPPVDNASVPVEYETADGFMSSFLLASDRDKIDTTNDYGVFYRVVYEASLEGDELIAYGSMDYRNSRDQDSITISSDLKHIFRVDDNTVYLKGGEESTETVSKEEFAELLDSRKNTGMFLGIETKNGVVTTAELSVQ